MPPPISMAASEVAHMETALRVDVLHSHGPTANVDEDDLDCGYENANEDAEYHFDDQE